MLLFSSTVANGFSIFNLQTREGYPHALLALPKSHADGETFAMQSSRRNVIGGSLAFLVTLALPSDPAMAKVRK